MTRFRGCIDIHLGQVKQIVGGTLTDDDITTKPGLTTNFVSSKSSGYYATLYRENNIQGCHVIKLGTNQANDDAAREACTTWPHALQVGGGITADNAIEWLDSFHASHVIVTSWLFKAVEGGMELDWARLAQISELVGKHRLVVDLSCRTVVNNGKAQWVVAMNKWQTLTQNALSSDFLDRVSTYCCEILVHAADVEGLCNGIDLALVEKLGEWCPRNCSIVYAGGAKLVRDLDTVKQLSNGKVDLTYGSALDLFGGTLVAFQDLVDWNRANSPEI